MEIHLFGEELAAGLLALALVVVPTGLGLLLGARLAGSATRIRSFRVITIVVVALILAGISFAVAWVGTLFRVGAWDGLQVGMLLGLGIAAGTANLHQRVSRSGLLLGIIATLVALCAVEFASRWYLPAAPTLPPVASARIIIARIDTEHMVLPEWHFVFGQMFDACGFVYPKLFPARFERRTRGSNGKPVILYLGDSMTYGLFLDLEQAFPALLEQRAPGFAHVNAASPGTSVDYHLLVARKWMDLLPVKLLVLNLFMNDIDEVDEGMPCCKDGPLLDYDGAEVRERCPVPTFIDGFGESFNWMLHNSPAPYPLRVATGFSALARHIDVAFMSKVSAIKYNRDLGPERKWQHFELLLQAISNEAARHGVPLVAVVLPVREGVEAKEPRNSVAYAVNSRMRQVSEKLGIRTLDPWEYFEDLVRQHGADRYFFPPDDIHFTAEGHVAMADWLAPRLGLTQ